MIVTLIEYLQKREKKIKVLSGIAIAVMLTWTMIGVDTSHAHTWIETHVPGFWAIFTILA